MSQALATEAGRQAAQKALGDALAVDDADEMALLLSAGASDRKARGGAAARRCRSFNEAAAVAVARNL